MDLLERIYLAGFPLLLVFTTFFPLLGQRSAVEFLPLMLTSLYCSIGLIWSFLRLGFIYLHEESSYQGQLSELK